MVNVSQLSKVNRTQKQIKEHVNKYILALAVGQAVSWVFLGV